MSDLWSVVGKLSRELHIDRVESASNAIARSNGAIDQLNLTDFFGPNVDSELVKNLKEKWLSNPDVSPTEIASALKAAARLSHEIEKEHLLEIVWTGPDSPFVATRKTEAVMEEVINSAKSQLFLVSYWLWNVDSILHSLEAATNRGVDLKVLMAKEEQRFLDAISLKVPGAKVYVSEDRKVHAKCLIADDKSAFITSANLTEPALKENIELGVLIRGGPILINLKNHLESLITTGEIVRV